MGIFREKDNNRKGLEPVPRKETRNLDIEESEHAGTIKSGEEKGEYGKEIQDSPSRHTFESGEQKTIPSELGSGSEITEQVIRSDRDRSEEFMKQLEESKVRSAEDARKLLEEVLNATRDKNGKN